MAGITTNTVRPLLEAVAFAARAHQCQLRKDGVTPYVSHVLRVCLVLRHTFGIDDSHALTADALHDTVEDTNTDVDELKEAFGEEVANWVALLSKDKRLPEEPLGLREAHESSSASMLRARWLCAVTSSSGGTCSSHSTSAGTRPNLCSAERYSSQTGSCTSPSCVSSR